jgi:hypothetical protein
MLTSDFDINKPIFKKQFCNWAPRYQKSIIDDVQLNSTVRGVEFRGAVAPQTALNALIYAAQFHPANRCGRGPGHGPAGRSPYP